MIDGLAMGCVYGVTTGCHTSCYNIHQVYTQMTTGCNTDRYNSSVVYTLHAIGVTTGRNTDVSTDQPVYTQLNVRHFPYANYAYFDGISCYHSVVV